MSKSMFLNLFTHLRKRPRKILFIRLFQCNQRNTVDIVKQDSITPNFFMMSFYTKEICMELDQYSTERSRWEKLQGLIRIKEKDGILRKGVLLLSGSKVTLPFLNP